MNVIHNIHLPKCNWLFACSVHLYICIDACGDQAPPALSAAKRSQYMQRPAEYSVLVCWRLSVVREEWVEGREPTSSRDPSLVTAQERNFELEVPRVPCIELISLAERLRLQPICENADGENLVAHLCSHSEKSAKNPSENHQSPLLLAADPQVVEDIPPSNSRSCAQYVTRCAVPATKLESTAKPCRDPPCRRLDLDGTRPHHLEVCRLRAWDTWVIL